jgi:hypothetical protein
MGIAPRARHGVFARSAHPDHYPAGMAQQSATLLAPIRGPSRFRLAVKPMPDQIRPYAWEVHDDERGTEEPVHRSARRFRTPKDAWQAGSIALELIQARALSSLSPMLNLAEEPT